MEPIKYKKGDVVDFIGTVHYTRPTGKVYFAVKPGVARVLAVIPNAAHPICLKGISSSVDGWVNLNTIDGIHQEEQKVEIISYAKSKIVKIASAQRGDTGIEIMAEPWKNKNWTVVYRLKNGKDAEKVAHMAEVGCTKKRFDNFDVDSINMAEICLFAAEIPVENISLKEVISSGLFFIFNNENYLTQFRYLKRGDILVGPTDSAVVLSNGPASSEIKTPINAKNIKEPAQNKPTTRIKSAIKQTEKITKKAEQKPESQDKTLIGTYETIVPASIRNGASTAEERFILVPKNVTMKNYGFYTLDPKTKVKWLYMQVNYKGNSYNGFVSEKCLIKK